MAIIELDSIFRAETGRHRCETQKHVIKHRNGDAQKVAYKHAADAVCFCKWQVNLRSQIKVWFRRAINGAGASGVNEALCESLCLRSERRWTSWWGWILLKHWWLTHFDIYHPSWEFWGILMHYLSRAISACAATEIFTQYGEPLANASQT